MSFSRARTIAAPTLVLLVILSGCLDPAKKGSAPTVMTVQDAGEAIRLARDCAAEEGYDNGQYNVTMVELCDDGWWLHFEYKEPTEVRGGHSHFGVWIRPDGDTELFRGR